MGIESLVGDTLVRNNQEKVPTSSLTAKYFMIYFSAHWCGPCRMFTPRLIEFYEKLKGKREDFELIFASSDKDQGSFDGYFSEMPWLAIPFERRDLKEKLSGKFKVRGIPTLVVVDQEGNLINGGARSEATQDPEGNDFPWYPPTLSELIGNEFLTKSGEVSKVDLEGKILGIYFSAHWCPPCKRFTPIFAEKYRELQAQGKNLEVIFVSSDRDQHSFDEYYGGMPWLAIPRDQTKRISKLSEFFDVEGIPSLVFLDSDRSVITKNGVGAIYGQKEFPFRPLPVEALTEENVSEVNEKPTLIIFAPSGQVKEMTSHLEPISLETKNAKKEMVFLVGEDGNPVTESVKGFAGVSGSEPAVVLLDIPAQRKFLFESGKTIDGESLKSFVDSFWAETLTPVGLRD